MRIFTAEQMAEVDRHAIEELGIPGPVLMENAASGLVDAVGELFPSAVSVAILCGPGNNGGDGLALARHLDGRGYGVRTFLYTKSDDPEGDDLGGDAGLQLRVLDAAGLEVVRVPPGDDAGSAEALDACRAADLVVDALFGTGLSRALEGRFAELVEALGRVDTPLLAVDLPSGLSGSSAEPPGPHLRADATVTFAAPKLAHVLLPAADACGRIVVTDLGLPAGVLESAPGSVHLTTLDEAAALAPERSGVGASKGRDTNKGTFGHVLVVAGRPGGAGAALLVTRAAVRAGAGLVTAAVPSSIRTELDLGSVESLTLPFELSTADPSDADPPDGWLGRCDLDRLREAARDRDVVAIGPALGTDDATREALRRVVPDLDVPMVLDADALGPFGGDAGRALLRKRPAATILTPHPGEMGRLLGCSTEEVQADRLDAARRAATSTGCVVVLKGDRTVVAIPPDEGDRDEGNRDEGDRDGGDRDDEAVELWIDPTGNAGLATGGTGDVLTGVLGGLLAQGLDAASAARLGVFLHGLAGDLAAETVGRRALAAGDVVDHLGAAWRRLLGDDA